jgi:hypothetical protein
MVTDTAVIGKWRCWFVQEINLYCSKILKLVQSLSKSSNILRDYFENNAYFQ